MKKIILTLMFVIVAALGAAALSACGPRNPDPNAGGTQETHNHVFEHYTVTQEATCTEDGYETAVCTLCDKTDTRVIPAKGHSWGEPTQVMPTCLNEGYTQKKCSVCNTTQKSEIVPATGHKWDIPAATCTQGQICEVCEKPGEPAHGHVYDEGVITTPVGCSEDGIKTYSCIECHDPEASKTEVYAKATGHILGEAEATEAVEGCKHTYTYSAECQSCHQPIQVGEPEVVEIHKYVAKITKQATCSEDGEKVYECSECKHQTDPENYKDENAHTWENPKTNGNITTYTCQNNPAHTRKVVRAESNTADVSATDLKSAGELELSNAAISLDDAAKGVLDGKKNINVEAGTLEGEDRTDALSSLEPGMKERVTGDIYNFTMEADGSQVTEFGGKVTIKIPYTLVEGEDPESIVIWYINGENLEPMEAVYTVIGDQGYAVFETEHFSYYTVTRMTPAERCALYGHNYVTRSANATCVTNGYIIEICTRCQDKAQDKIIPATGHNWTENTQAATCTQNGKITKHCQNCEITLESTIFATGHKWALNEELSSAATCSASGMSHYDCSECDESYEILEAQKAHKWQTNVIAPTCTLEGYTHKECVNCDATVNTDVKAALGHYMVDTVVAPTCTEKGYTSHECSRCGYKTDNTNEKAALGHSMENGVCSRCGAGCSHDWQQTAAVGATCTEAGYTEMTCSKCSSVKRENVTAALGHEFGFKECSRCHAPNPALGDYYYNLLSSMYVKGFALKLTDFQMIQERKVYVGGVLDEERSVVTEEERQIGVIEMFISIDEGELYGAGRATMHAKTRNYSYNNVYETVESDYNVTIILQDAKLYMSSEVEESSYGSEYNVFDFDSIFGEEFSYEKVTAALKWMDGYGKNILGDIAGTNKIVANAVLGKVFGLLFGEPASTENGYRFTIDAANLKAINADLSKLTVSAIVDKYMGEGTFDAIRENVNALLNRNVLELYGKIKLGNIDYEELCAAINAFMIDIMGAPEFDAQEMLDEYFAENGPLDATLADVLADFAQQFIFTSEGGAQQEPLTGEQLIAMVDGYFKQAEELIVYEMFGDQGEDIQGMVAGYIDMIGEMADISFTTDKDGNIDSAFIGVDVKDYVVYEYEYDDETIKSLITFKGNAELKFNGTINVDFVKDGLDKIERSVRIGKNIKATSSATQYGVTTTIELNSDGAGNITSVTEYRDNGRRQTGYGAEYLEGVRRNYVDYEVTMTVSSIVVNNGSAQISTSSLIICNGWRRYSVYGNSTETEITRYVRTYFDAEGNILSEVKLQADVKGEPYASSRGIYFYYKAETNELSVKDTPHEYEPDEARSVPAQGCEGEGYILYVCKLCNDERKSYYTNGHIHTFRKVELEDGSETCEDGVIITEICRDCNKELYSYKSNYHEMGETVIDVKDYGSKCGGEIIVRACACGKNLDVEWGNINCDMHRVGDDGGTEGTYKCAVTDCPFEYTLKSELVHDPHGSPCDYIIQHTYMFGTNTSNPVKAIENYGRTTDHKNLTKEDFSDSEPVEGKDGALFTITCKSGYLDSCSACGYKYGQEETTVYYFSDESRTLLVKRHTESKNYNDDYEQSSIIDETFDGTERGGILTYKETETYISRYGSVDKDVTVTEITFRDDKMHGAYYGDGRPISQHTTTERYVDGKKRSSSVLNVEYDTYGNALRSDENIILSRYGIWGFFYEGYLGNYEYSKQMFDIDGKVSNTTKITIRYDYNYGNQCYYDLHISSQSDGYGDNFNLNKEKIENHIAAEKSIVSEATCTQDEVYIVTCSACNYRGEERMLGGNKGHHYVYDDLTGRFVCDNCGLENEKNVDGIYILEDLTQKEGYVKEGYYVIGYNYNRSYSDYYRGEYWNFNRFYNELFKNHYHPFGFTVEVSLYAEGKEIPLNIDCEIVGLNGEDHTLIYVDMAQVAELAKQQNITDYGVMISFVFNDDSGLACNITLDPTDYVQ